MNSRVLLLDGSCDLDMFSRLNRKNYHTVICLFWAAPQTKKKLEYLTGGRCYSLSDIAGNTELWELKTYNIVKNICNSGPKYRGFPWRSHLTDQIYRECLSLMLATATVDFINNIRRMLNINKIEVDYVLTAQNINIFKKILSESEIASTILFNSYSEKYYVPLHQSSRLPLLKRWMRHFRGSLITGNWKVHLWNMIEKLDKHYEIRCKWKGSHLEDSLSPAGITFFSSYLNNSRILRAFEDVMPAPVNWVVTNYYAREGALPSSNPIEWIWQYAPKESGKLDIKDYGELDFEGSESDKNGVFTKWLFHTTIWENWEDIHLSSLGNLTSCWENYLEQLKPKLIVMANQWGIEGWFTQIARHRGIPVLQVMHGVLGGYLYTQTPIISDTFVVPGDFWLNLWPEEQRHKIVVYNPEGYITKVQKRMSPSKRCLTFFSWPLASSPSYNFSEFMDAFIRIFHKLLHGGSYEIIVRTHPLENPSDFVQRWKHLYGAIPPGLTLNFGKHDSLGHVLERTDVALMFRSTVLLNCLASGIPVVIPGWIDFGWEQSLMDNLPGIYLAKDFEDIETCLMDWLESPPHVGREAAEYFVSPAGKGKDEFYSFIENMVSAARLN